MNFANAIGEKKEQTELVKRQPEVLPFPTKYEKGGAPTGEPKTKAKRRGGRIL